MHEHITRSSTIFKISQGCWIKGAWTRWSPDVSSSPKNSLNLWFCVTPAQCGGFTECVGSTENLSSSELAAGGKVGHGRANLSFECKNKNEI